MRLNARPPGRLPRFVLGDGRVDLGFLNLLGGCAVPQGLQRVVLKAERSCHDANSPRRQPAGCRASTEDGSEP
jgi:hypothetical protein